MATAPLSPSTIASASEAFQLPLPSVRQFHKQLQAALDEKNARLRTLVGSSYRQLLGTAETIVRMRADMEAVEEKLGRVADGCGRSAVGKKVTGLGRLSTVARDGGAAGVELGWVAKVKVLSGSVVVVGRLLVGKEVGTLEARLGQSKAKGLVTAGKVLVLARLLMKSLGGEAKNGESGVDGAEELMEEMRRKLGGLRRRLLRGVDRILEKVDCEKEDLVQALCAYSLATSSGAKDVLRHFLHVRGNAMALKFDEEEEQHTKELKGDSVMLAFELYTKTLLDVQALVPRRLSDALLSLKSKSLLKDDAIQALEGLRLDVSERWLGDEIMFFTLYIRHDDLDFAQAAETLKGWAKRASEVLLQGFERTLGHITDIKTVVELRAKVFEMWIREGGKAKGFDPSVMLNGLRKVVNDRMVNLLEARISKLHLVGTEIEATITSWQSSHNGQQRGLWDEELLNMDLEGGAGQFKQAVLSHVHGRNDTVFRVFKSYETWRHLIDELFTIIDQLKSQKWDDDLESLEDDDSLEKRSDLLSKDDPGMLQGHINATLQKVYRDLHRRIAALLAAHEDSEHIGGITVYVLRVLRDLRAKLPKIPDLTLFGLSLIPELHNMLASTTTADSISTFIMSVSKQKKVVGRALWEGSPELPVQPSPTTFKLLYRLTSSMAAVGNDLWSPAAVIVLRRYLCDKLGQEWGDALEHSARENEPQVNGHVDEGIEPATDEAEPSEELLPETKVGAAAPKTNARMTKRRDIWVQSLFDIYVLQHCLLPPFKGRVDTGSKDNKLTSLRTLLKERSDLPDSSNERLQQVAKEYWKRTSLLFGLLA